MTLGLIPRAFSSSFIIVSCLPFVIGSAFAPFKSLLLAGRDCGVVLCDVGTSTRRGVGQVVAAAVIASLLAIP